MRRLVHSGAWALFALTAAAVLSGCAVSGTSHQPPPLQYADLVGTWQPQSIYTDHNAGERVSMHYLVFTPMEVMQRVELADNGPQVSQMPVMLGKDDILYASPGGDEGVLGPVARVKLHGETLTLRGAGRDELTYRRISTETSHDQVGLVPGRLDVHQTPGE